MLPIIPSSIALSRHCPLSDVSYQPAHHSFDHCQEPERKKKKKKEPMLNEVGSPAQIGPNLIYHPLWKAHKRLYLSIFSQH
ncbi:hypothetical protein POVWA2_010390 [Plasmodium ovale wallikeri]|uniref:Uncharacterized protein n=1 Tax=Plasmodium ovale wallikeri TaxID=864142 RepID=A0A1A8YKI2_PLAOA|nr:hypothetical protein POVWA1_010170 [Plasmodium ovale wallikeri]SBT32583.1 hypothetical protein POVWA2_010390 [Plasmodium ovale wallikeri]